MAGGGKSSSNSVTNTKFERTGTQQLANTRSLPGFLGSIIETNTKGTEIPSAIAAGQNSFQLDSLLRDPNNLPHQSVLNSNAAINPTSYTGRSTLESIATRDPYSSNYEAETGALFDDTVNRAVSSALTGPETVRGGQAAAQQQAGEARAVAGINRFRELSQQQNVDANQATQATGALQNIDNQRRGIALGSQDQNQRQIMQQIAAQTAVSDGIERRRDVGTNQQALAADSLGAKLINEINNMQGWGVQSGASNQTTMGVEPVRCCWIFLEHYQARVLPPHVRMCRDTFYTPRLERGYRRTARLLVPLMRYLKPVRKLVANYMCTPMERWGAWFFGLTPDYNQRNYDQRVKQFWFKFWNFIGR